MIILDTEVLTETQKTSPDGNVMAFLESLDPTITYITAISVAEIQQGIQAFSSGRQQKELEDSATALFRNIFKKRVLPFDAAAATHCARGTAEAHRGGNAIELATSMIAGIALAHLGATVATRNTAPFKAMGINVIDPWAPR